MLHLRYKILTILFLGTVALNIKAIAKTIVFQDTSKSILVGKYIEVFEDKKDNVTIDQILNGDVDFVPCNVKVPNFGTSTSSFWLHFKLINRTTIEQLILTVANPMLDEVFLYSIDSKNGYNVVRTGDNYPFKQRIYPVPEYLFDIKSSGLVADFYLKVRTKQHNIVPISLQTKHRAEHEQRKKNITFGIYAGIILVMFLFNSFIYFSTRDMAYLFYLCYIMMIGLTLMSIEGYAYKYFWSEFPTFSNSAIVIFGAFAGLAGGQFVIYFLKLKSSIPLLKNIIYVVMAIHSISLISILLGKAGMGYQILNYTSLVLAILGLLAGILSLMKYRPALIFLIAWTVLLIGIIIYVLKNFDVLPFNFFTKNTMIIGSAIEVILLSLALSYRMDLMRVEKDEMRKKLIAKDKLSMLGLMLSGIGHSIKDAVNYMRSNVTSIRADIRDISNMIKLYDKNNQPNEAEFDELMVGLEEGTSRTWQIIGSLNNYAGEDHKGIEEVSLEECINSCLVLLSKRMKGNIKVTCEDKHNAHILGRKGELNQFFLNVLTNAIQAIEIKEDVVGEIIINIDMVDNQYKVSISDNGIGMNNHVKERAFDLFFTTKKAAEGTGLGLPITRSIIKKHGGEVSISSEEGVGTTFYAFFPYK